MRLFRGRKPSEAQSPVAPPPPYSAARDDYHDEKLLQDPPGSDGGAHGMMPPPQAAQAPYRAYPDPYGPEQYGQQQLPSQPMMMGQMRMEEGGVAPLSLSQRKLWVKWAVIGGCVALGLMALGMVGSYNGDGDPLDVAGSTPLIIT